MTHFTNRNNIKPVFWLIAVPVMVLLCRLRAVMTKQSIRAGQFASRNSVVCSSSSLSFFRIFNVIFLLSLPAFFTFLITSRFFSMHVFALFCLSVFFHFCQLASFTTTKMAIFMAIVFVKIRKQFDLLATSASFRYSCLGHSRFSLNSERLCLEPNTRPILVSGSLCYNSFGLNVN